jgi:superfamily II DNA/RNA helicase
VVLTGKDVMGAAQTGTGKTAAFSLPLLQRLLARKQLGIARAPPGARPGAAAHARAGRPGGPADRAVRQAHQLRSTVVFGGMDMKPQTIELKRASRCWWPRRPPAGPHRGQERVLNQVEYVVLDEADRMLDIGFLPDLQRILSYLPKSRTTLLFSATFSPEIKRLAGSYLQDPVTIEVARPNETASTVEQRFYSADDDKRRAIRQCSRSAAQAGLRFRQQQAGLCAPGTQPGARRPQDRRPARRQEPGRAPEGAGGLQERRGGSAGVHRRGGARPGHQGRAGGVQLRRALQRRGLRAPHRPHRPRRRLRPGAVTLVTSSDTRLVADIEKLIKKKIELEPLELAEDRPRGRFNDGRRAWREDGEDNRCATRGGPERSSYRSAPAVVRDPFFDKP